MATYLQTSNREGNAYNVRQSGKPKGKGKGKGDKGKGKYDKGKGKYDKGKGRGVGRFVYWDAEDIPPHKRLRNEQENTTRERPRSGSLRLLGRRRYPTTQTPSQRTPSKLRRPRACR
jgi:hypothetical protein